MTNLENCQLVSVTWQTEVTWPLKPQTKNESHVTMRVGHQRWVGTKITGSVEKCSLEQELPIIKHTSRMCTGKCYFTLTDMHNSIQATCFWRLQNVNTCHVLFINKTLSNEFEFRLIYVLSMTHKHVANFNGSVWLNAAHFFLTLGLSFGPALSPNMETGSFIL